MQTICQRGYSPVFKRGEKISGLEGPKKLSADDTLSVRQRTVGEGIDQDYPGSLNWKSTDSDSLE